MVTSRLGLFSCVSNFLSNLSPDHLKLWLDIHAQYIIALAAVVPASPLTLISPLHTLTS
jgi:hypothetical protein